MKSRFQNLRHWLRSANLLEFLGAIPALEVQRKGIASQGESFLTVGTTGTTGRPGGGVTSCCEEQPGGVGSKGSVSSGFSVRDVFSESCWCQFGDN